MSDTPVRAESSDVRPTTDAVTMTWLAVSWLWVTIPLGWGVSQTIMKSLALFETFKK